MSVGSSFGQEITIRTSADIHDSRFFGEGILQVMVTDPDAEDDSTVEEIEVDISGQPDTGTTGSDSILVPETSSGSGRFELFLAHVDASAVGPDDLDSANTAGVEGDGTCVADCAPFVTFGPGGQIDLDADLYEEVTFEIRTDNAEVEVTYEESAGTLGLDRNSYGTTSFVYIKVADQDANLNPFENDEFTVDPQAGPNDDLLVLGGGTFEDAVVFRETGDNTAIFEGRYRLGESMSVDSESLVLTFFDKANYNATLAAPENDSNNTYEVSFTVGNSDGTIDIGGGEPAVLTWDPVLASDKSSYVLGENVRITITDPDANVHSDMADSIELKVSSDSTEDELTATETDAKTGTFEAVFQIAEETDVTVTYTDERPADYFDKVQAGQSPEKDFRLEINIEPPLKTGIDATDVAAPLSEDASGESGPYAIGDSITVSTTITNNNDNPQPFVAIIEVRDRNGVTVFLALRSGTLEPSGSTDIGVLWRPDATGVFELRTFAITSVGDAAELISLVAVSHTTIS